MRLSNRFRWGWAPGGGKKADLMFVQHMVAVLKANGVAATVMPHGVLFRGGAERDIRTALLDDDIIEAVIGLAPNLFYGTGIPACVLVLRAPASKPADRAGKVLFINADPRVRRRPHPELPAPRAHREDRVRVRGVHRYPRLRPRRDLRRAPRQRRQPQHPPVRRQRPTAGAARRARPPARRHPESRGRRQGRPIHRARLHHRGGVHQPDDAYYDFAPGVDRATLPALATNHTGVRATTRIARRSGERLPACATAAGKLGQTPVSG